MCNTDRVLITKDRYLHLGLSESRNHLPAILFNSLKPIGSNFPSPKKQLLVYVDDRLPWQDALKWFRDNHGGYENVYVINLNIKRKKENAGLYKIPFSQFERQCEVLKRNELKLQMKKFTEFHKRHPVRLTRTEHEIVQHMLIGSSVSVVAKDLECSTKVVYTHKYNIVKKYGYKSFNELYINILAEI